MLILSLILFVASLIVIGVAVSRGLSGLDEILVVVEPGTPEPTSALARADG